MKPEQEAEEILIQEGFAEPEELEPEVAELLREASILARQKGNAWMIPFFKALEKENE